MPAIALNIGIDIESVARFRGMDDGPQLNALFSKQELLQSTTAADGAACLTAMWCAKEAVVKAVWPWVHLEPRLVLVTRRGRRMVVRIEDRRVDELGLQINVNTAEAGNLAVATAVAQARGSS